MIREMHWNRSVDEICVVIGHCSAFPLYEVPSCSHSCRLVSFFLCLAGGQTVCFRHIRPHFSCGMASVLHKKAVYVVKYCSICSDQESHKRDSVVPEVQKSVGCVTSWKRGGLWVSFKQCM